MIPAELYQDVYLIIVMLLVLFTIPSYKIQENALLYQNGNHKCIWLLIFFIFFIGLRPLSNVFADMSQYVGYLSYWKGLPFHVNFLVENKIYDNLMMFLACNDFPYPLFYILIAAIYFSCYYICFRKLFGNDILVVFILFLSAFMTFTSSTNGIKAGAATAIFMIAVAYYENWKVWLPILLVSWGFHHAMQLLIVAFLLTKFYRNTYFYFYFWFFCLMCATAHVTVFQTIFADYTDEKGALYLMGNKTEWGGKSGLRIDFVLYSAMPVLVGYYAIIKKQFADVFYERILSIYLFANSLWMLCMYVPYNNRIAALSWGMYVVVLFYPVLRCAWPGNREMVFRKMALTHFGFTFAMHFIYYAFIHLNR